MVQKLSDKMIDLGAKLPETRVLEHKLAKIVKLEPQVKETLAKVNQLTVMPAKEAVVKIEGDTQKTVKKIEDAVSKEQSESEKHTKSEGKLPAKK